MLCGKDLRRGGPAPPTLSRWYIKTYVNVCDFVNLSDLTDRGILLGSHCYHYFSLPRLGVVGVGSLPEGMTPRYQNVLAHSGLEPLS